MDRRRTGVLAGALTLTALLTLVVVSAAAALDFVQSDPCKDSDPAWICPSGVVDAPYSIKYAVSGDGAGPPFSFALIWGEPPVGLTLRSDGVISGTPTQAGNWTFGVQLFDKVGNKGGDNDFTITIVPRVLVTTPAVVPATTGVPYSLALSAVMKTGPTTTSTPPSPPTWTVTSGQLPPGLTLGATDGVISGTPTTEGSYPFVVRAALIDGRADTNPVKIDVRVPVAVAARTVPRSEIGVPFLLALTASGGTGTYAWTLSSGALPSGVALTANGAIAGIPLAAGAFRFTATATDTEGRKADYPGALTVAQRLKITTLVLRPAKVGRQYRQKVVTSGGVIPKVLRVASGPLPRGIRFDRTLGVLSGIPIKPGTYRLTFDAVDALKVHSTKTLKLVVAA